jgi:type IV secretion system protein VirB9
MKKIFILILSIITAESYAAGTESSATAQTNPVVIITTNDQNNAQAVKSTVNSLLPAPKSVKKHITYGNNKKPNVNIGNMNFDYNYSGDITGALQAIQDIDYSVRINPSSGKKQNIPISITASNWNIAQLLDSINAQAGGYATVQYNPNNNSVKIIYSSKIRTVADDVMNQSRQWRYGHRPKPVTTPDGVIEYPYGFYQPVVPCRIGMNCDIRLDAGEVLNNWAISDIGNWQMYGGNENPRFAYVGTGTNKVPHVWIKPGDSASTANLLIATNKRSYNIVLQATRSDDVPSIGFYYPDQIFQQQEDQKQAQRDNALQNNNSYSGMSESDTIYGTDLASLNINDYEVSGDDVSWKPITIFYDGTHVFIKFPENMQTSPVLLEIPADGDNEDYKALRYWPQPGNIYRVDKMFDKAVLLKGINDNTKKVYITKKKAEVSIWHKIFG